MAGIGISLKTLLSQDRLGSVARGYLHAAVIAAGPWLATSLAIVTMLWMGQGLLRDTALIRFSGVALWAFSLSLVVAAPFALVLSRSLADAVYRRDVSLVSSMAFQSLAAVSMTLALLGALLFGVVLELPLLDRVLGFALLMACGGVWVVSAMLAALRSYRSITTAFVVGLLLACLVCYFTVFALRGSALLWGLVVGLSAILFMLLARVLAEFPATDPLQASSVERAERRPFKLSRAMRHHRVLAWAGCFYAAGLWVDKWVMWQAPGAFGFGRGILSHPAYESAMFLAGLTMVPTLVLLLVNIETRFHERYRDYQRCIGEGGTLRAIRRHHGALVRVTSASMWRLLLVQGVVALMAVVSAPAVVASLGGSADMVPILRFGIVGAAFHAVLVVCLAALAYFDQPRWMLRASISFFVVNALATMVATTLGPEYHGWGYALASLVAAAVAFHGATQSLAQLPYLSFIGANDAILRPQTLQRARRSKPRASASVLAHDAA